jgi:hypothetical protein
MVLTRLPGAASPVISAWLLSFGPMLPGPAHATSRVRSAAAGYVRLLRSQPAACAGGTTAIAPCPSAVDTVAVGATASLQFQISNASTTDHSYSAQCSPTGSVSSCTVDQPQLTVTAASSASIAVAYTASGPLGVGAVVLQLDGGGADVVSAPIAITIVAATTPAPSPTAP